jgi:DNA-3-methyladenine glycosylase II
VTVVALPAPLDLSSSLELFRRSGDDLIDRWDGTTLVRTTLVDGRRVAFAATPCGTRDNPAMAVQSDAPAVLDVVRHSFFVPSASGHYAELLRRDPVLAELDAEFPGVRQIRQLDLFTALIRCISAQQVNLRWACTTRRRLAERFGACHEVDGHVVYSLDPARIASVKPEEIRALQFTTSKAVAIVAVARHLVDSGMTRDTLDALADDEVIARLVAIRGIGRWSAEWVLNRTLGRPVVVAGDLGVRKAVGLAYVHDPLPSDAAVREATRHWGESANVAQAVLLHALVEGRLDRRLGLA